MIDIQAGTESASIPSENANMKVIYQMGAAHCISAHDIARILCVNHVHLNPGGTTTVL
jgi:hypothetical protein